MKDVKHGRLQIAFWSGKWSCFKVRVRVRALFMSSTAYASTKGGKHFLDHKVTPTPEMKRKKKKVKDVFHDKLRSRNDFGSPASPSNLIFWSFHLLHGTSDGCITFSWRYDYKKE